VGRIITLIVLGFLLAAFFDEDTDSWPRETFTATEWSRTAEVGRYVFVRDLLDRGLLQGKTLSEVKALLGVPSFDGLKAPDHYITYVVKVGGRGFDQVFILDIRFNASTDKVEEAFIRGK
jgi:hypothetical protein